MQSLLFLLLPLLYCISTVSARFPLPSPTRIAAPGGKSTDTDEAISARLAIAGPTRIAAATVESKEEPIGSTMWRRALAGGLAGSFATLLLYPIDTLKTMRQSDSTLINIQKAISTLRARGVLTVYAGLLPATIGSFASSSIYFGSYETCKRLLLSSHALASALSRQSIHMLAAVSGNLASSFLFVPKDALKQQMQALRTGALPSLPGMSAPPSRLARSAAPASFAQVARLIYSTKGVKGFYPSYRATLLRNIPSAVVRFAVYEELRLLVLRGGQGRWRDAGFFLVGGLASALSSAATTPLDVVKTRLATGAIPPGTPVLTCLRDIVKKEGYKGLFLGLPERLVWSGLYGGVGLGAFEVCKRALGEGEGEGGGLRDGVVVRDNGMREGVKNGVRKGVVADVLRGKGAGGRNL